MKVQAKDHDIETHRNEDRERQHRRQNPGPGNAEYQAPSKEEND
jgi:hypothetical protein